MLLSYILHGNIPLYSSDPPHPDHVLDAKLQTAPELLNADVHSLTAHFGASRLSYSTEALPVNVLLDTLVRPSVDVDESNCISNVEWHYRPESSVPHLVYGKSSSPGGQWADDSRGVDWDIQTLSYAATLSLPGYSFADHHRKVSGKELPAYTRPTRREVAEYFRAYPQAVHIDNVFRCDEELSGISRHCNGFYIRSHNIFCKRLILASGIHSETLPPDPILQPLLRTRSGPSFPLLVIGSGFTAADAIISASADQKILHVFKWSPDDRPSPLRNCQPQAYPEYAGVYYLMKRAALMADTAGKTRRSTYQRTTSAAFYESRDWDELYEGVANADIISADALGNESTVMFRLQNGKAFSRSVRGVVYAAGRRGTLGYLDSELRCEVLGHTLDNPGVSGQTLRTKAAESLEIAPGVYIIGSSTGDSLVRFAYGSCVYTGGRLMEGNRGMRSIHSNFTLAAKPHASSPTATNSMDGDKL